MGEMKLLGGSILLPKLSGPQTTTLCSLKKANIPEAVRACQPYNLEPFPLLIFKENLRAQACSREELSHFLCPLGGFLGLVPQGLRYGQADFFLPNLD